jgi:membrane protease YdiL (CAAX protease family)
MFCSLQLQEGVNMRTSNLLTRFFLVSFGLCWLITIPIAMQVQGQISIHILPTPTQWLIGLAPLLAAAWVTYGSNQREQWLAGALRVHVPTRWYAFAALLPWAILAIALAGYALTGQPLPRVRFGASMAVFAMVWLILGYGEEAGWRAFALPQLLRLHSFWAGATILGVLWCVWHYPKLFASPYLHVDATGLRLVAQFSIQILVANYLLCWLFVRTKSAVIAALFHASWNLVASAYALAATDMLITLTLACVTALVLYLDRARLGIRLAWHATARKHSQSAGRLDS